MYARSIIERAHATSTARRSSRSTGRDMYPSRDKSRKMKIYLQHARVVIIIVAIGPIAAWSRDTLSAFVCGKAREIAPVTFRPIRKHFPPPPGGGQGGELTIGLRSDTARTPLPTNLPVLRARGAQTGSTTSSSSSSPLPLPFFPFRRIRDKSRPDEITRLAVFHSGGNCSRWIYHVSISNNTALARYARPVRTLIYESRAPLAHKRRGWWGGGGQAGRHLTCGASAKANRALAARHSARIPR